MGPRKFYREGMSRAAQLMPKQGLDLLVVLIAVVTAEATMQWDDPRHPSGPLLVLGLAGMTSAVLVLLFRRAFLPSELSGGQQQRVAPCRPFAHRHAHVRRRRAGASVGYTTRPQPTDGVETGAIPSIVKEKK